MFQAQTALLLSSCLRSFGEPAVYLPVQSTQRINITVIFDETFRTLDVETGTTVQSTQPKAGIKLSELPFEPRAGDRLLIRNKTYRITEYQPDGQGGAEVLLTEKSNKQN